MATKVTSVKKAPTKATPVKAPGKTNPARELKVLKAFTVSHDLESSALITAISLAFDKHGKVAVTAQGDKALDRKMQQRVQSIGYRRGYNFNLSTAVTDTHVVACPKNPEVAKSEVQAPATPRAPKAAAEKKTPARKIADDIAKKIVADPKARAAVEKAAKTVKGSTTRKATVKRRTPAQDAYDRTFAAKDAEIKAQAEADQKAQESAIAKLRADKEAEAAESGTTPADLEVPADLAAKMAANLVADQERIAREEAGAPADIVIGGTTVLAVVAPDHDEQVRAGVLAVGEALVKSDVAPTDGLRIGVRGKDPVIETNYGLALGQPFKGRAVADDVLREIDRLRVEATTEA